MSLTNNDGSGTSQNNNNSEEMLANLGGVEIIYQPLENHEIQESIKKNLAPLADNTKRLLLARNLVPLPPKDMIVTLYCLLDDNNQAVRDAAEDSFDDIPPNLLRNISSQQQPAKILDYIARNFYDDDDPEQIIQTLILNKSTSTDTMLLLTRVGSPRILEMISNNQTRIQRSPKIVFEFPKNPRVSIALVSRVLEFARRQKLITIDEENNLIDNFIDKMKPKDADVVPVEQFVEEIKTEEGEIDWAFPSFMTTEFEADLGLDAEAAIIEDKINSKLNMRDLVRQLTVPQKIRMAARGNMEARNILIMDPLAIVAREVLKSPRITKTEIERAAESRLVDMEILEIIGKSAVFTRSYAVRHALVTNPKSPLPIANKLMSTLMEKDIKIISKSRAVPQTVSSIARQKIDAQEIRRQKRKKKKK